MKRVRPLLGVAAIATPAVAVLAAAPQAAAVAHTPRHLGKKVSLHVQSRPRVDTGCDGATRVFMSSWTGGGEFWYTNHTSTGKTCIGTVKIFGGNGSQYNAYRLRIYSNVNHTGGANMVYSSVWPHKLPLASTHSWGVHKSWPDSIRVCGASRSVEFGSWHASCQVVP
jgi:hypothetical protein